MVKKIFEILKDKNIRRGIIFFIAVFLLIIPIFINLLFKIYIDNLFSAEWSAGDMLSFYGSILGGCLTLFGVMITLKHQEKDSLERDLIKYKPILDVETIESFRNYFGGNRDIILRNQYGSYFNTEDSRFVQQTDLIDSEASQIFHVLIKNKGRGETTESILKNLKITEDSLEVFPKLYIGTSGEISLGEILVDQKIDLVFHLPNYISVNENFEQDSCLISIELLIAYEDIFGILKRDFKLIVQLNVVLLEEIKPSENWHVFEKEKLFCVSYEDPACMQNTVIIEKVE
ncbi:hypothetical protein ACA346_10080 [Streptococcus parasuis]|uniref:hypothetical protein n=1 Tax=Streptococcus parasuis TaxID=1501662 RepID=UPI003AAEA80A